MELGSLPEIIAALLIILPGFMFVRVNYRHLGERNGASQLWEVGISLIASLGNLAILWPLLALWLSWTEITLDSGLSAALSLAWWKIPALVLVYIAEVFMFSTVGLAFFNIVERIKRRPIFPRKTSVFEDLFDEGPNTANRYVRVCLDDGRVIRGRAVLRSFRGGRFQIVVGPGNDDPAHKLELLNAETLQTVFAWPSDGIVIDSERIRYIDLEHDAAAPPILPAYRQANGEPARRFSFPRIAGRWRCRSTC